MLPEEKKSTGDRKKKESPVQNRKNSSEDKNFFPMPAHIFTPAGMK